MCPQAQFPLAPPPGKEMTARRGIPVCRSFDAGHRSGEGRGILKRSWRCLPQGIHCTRHRRANSTVRDKQCCYLKAPRSWHRSQSSLPATLPLPLQLATPQRAAWRGSSCLRRPRALPCGLRVPAPPRKQKIAAILYKVTPYTPVVPPRNSKMRLQGSKRFHDGPYRASCCWRSPSRSNTWGTWTRRRGSRGGHCRAHVGWVHLYRSGRSVSPLAMYCWPIM